jgi:uncharacterized membrane protein YccF (DUF307 family)
MKSAVGKKRGFNTVAWIAFGLMLVCLVKYTSGNVTKPLVSVTNAIVYVLGGKVGGVGYLTLALILALIVLWSVFAARNIKNKTTHYLAPANITVICASLLPALADRNTLIKQIQANNYWVTALVVLLAVFIVFAFIASIFDFIQIGQEKKQPKAAEIAAAKDEALEARVAELEKKLNEAYKDRFVVYVYGNGQTSSTEPAKKGEPVKEEKKEEAVSPKTEPAKTETHPEPAKSVTAGSEVKNKLDIPRVPFKEKILQADVDTKKNYNAIKNHLIAYNAKSRISVPFDTFHYGMDTLVKISVNQKSLKVYFALPPKSFASTPYPIEDASKHKNTEAVPSLLKVRSSLSVRRAIKLIDMLMEKKNIHLKAKAPAEKDYVQEIKKSSK